MEPDDVPRMYLSDLADDAKLDHRHRGAVRTVRVRLDTHLRHQLGSVGRLLSHSPRLVDAVSERFLTVYVLAHFKRRDRDGSVHVVGDRGVD